MDCVREHAAESDDCKGMSARFNTAANCPDDWLGDGECDEECSTPANQWDGGDCEDQMPAGFCPSNWLADGECDAVCNTRAHQWDRGDCSCDDSHALCPERVASGVWSCETMLCPSCPKAHLCDLSCDDHKTSDERWRLDLPTSIAGRGAGGNWPACPNAAATPPVPAPAATGGGGSQCPAADAQPTVLSTHCENEGGVCVADKASCTGLLRGTGP